MISRTLQAHILSTAKLFPVVTVTGPRQSGKTTLVRAAFPSHTYLNLENLDDRAAAVEDPRSFLKYHGSKGVIIDEAQKVPELFSYLQQIVDESGRMGRYILTGSQNFLLLKNVSQSLAGRVAVSYLLPFCLDELTGGRSRHSIENRELNELLFTGFYPPIYDRNIPAESFFPSYLQTYVERDVRSLKNIGNLNLYRRFLQLCAGRAGQMVNLAAIGNELGMDAKTVRSWLSVLEASFIIFFLPPYFRNFNKRVVKHSKLYFYDTGVVCSLLGLTDSSQLANHYMRGAIFENLIISEYFKSQYHNGLIPNAFFWRDNTGNEIDLLIDQAGALTAVEIKSGATINSHFFSNLIKFRKYSGIGAENCYLVYGGKQDMPRKNGYVMSWKSFALSSLPVAD